MIITAKSLQNDDFKGRYDVNRLLNITIIPYVVYSIMNTIMIILAIKNVGVLIDDCCERKSVDLVVKFLEVNIRETEALT